MSNGDVGPVVRRMRRGAGMTLAQLSHATGLSQSFLSQFERGKSEASISSLRLITDALGMNMNDVFEISSSEFTSLVRYSNRPSLPFGDRATKTIVTSRGLSRFEMFEVTFEVGGSTGHARYSHGNHEELLLVVEGVVGIELDETRQLLDVGDAISFQSSVPHRVANAGGTDSRVLWTVSPPAYMSSVPRPTSEGVSSSAPELATSLASGGYLH